MPVRDAAASFRGVDHVALTVLDLDAVVDFYCSVLGAELLYRMCPFDAAELLPMESGQDWSDARVGVAGARIHIAMLRLFSTLRFELLQYELPRDRVEIPPRNCDAGSPHLCLEVSDLDGAVQYLKGHGCVPAAAPICVPAGAAWPASTNWYVRDPFGHQLELLQVQRTD